MAVTVPEKTKVPDHVDARILSRILEEGYGPGAWHGNDMRAAIADVSAAEAFWRPGKGRHNIAELVLHHAYFVRQVRGQLADIAPAPFVLEGQDWFDLPDERVMPWTEITRVLDREQRQLADLVEKWHADRGQSSAPRAQAFDLVLGITCHAVYHAAQIQLLKKLQGK